MPDDIRLGIRLEADAKGFTGEMRLADRELDKLSRRLGQTPGPARAAAAATDELTRSTRSAGRAFLDAHGRHVKYLSSLASIEVFRRAARAGAQYADAWTRVNNAVRLATESEEAALRVRGALFEIADETRAPISAAVSLYQRLAQAAGELGATEDQLLAVVRGVGQSLAIQGTSSTEAAGALLQLSQALGGGVVRAEEFNSLLEGAPVLLRTVARHLEGAGGSVARLRRLVNEGEVSSQEFFRAFLRGSGDLEDKFGRTAGTLGQAFTRLDNQTTQLVGAADEIAGASALAARAIEGLGTALGQVDPEQVARALELVGKAALAAGAALGTRLVGSLLTAGAQSAIAAAQMAAVQVALGRMEGRSRSAAVALTVFSRAARAARGALALLGGPWGVLGLVAYGAWEVWSAVSRSREEVRGLAEDARSGAGGLRDLTDAYRDLTDAERDRERSALRVRRAAAQTAIVEERMRQSELVAEQERASQRRSELERERDRLDVSRDRGLLSTYDHVRERTPLDRDIGDLDRQIDDLEGRLTRGAERLGRYISGIDRIDEEIAALAAIDGEPNRGRPTPPPPPGEPASPRAGPDHSDFAGADRALREARARMVRLRRDAARIMDDVGDELATPYDRAVRQAERWGEENRRILLAAGASAEELGAVNEAVQQRIAAAAREAADEQARAAEDALRSATDWRSGLERGLRDLTRESQDLASQAERAITGAFHSTSDALAEFVAGGKVQLADLANSVVRSFARIATDRATAWLFNTLLGGLGRGAAPSPNAGIGTGPGAGGVPVPHAGGVVGAITRRRYGVPPELFIGAPRLHGGGLVLGPNEVPAILERGERVIPRREAMDPPPAPVVVVNVENRGTAQQAGEAETRWDGRRWVTRVVLDDVARGGPIRRAIAGVPR